MCKAAYIVKVWTTKMKRDVHKSWLSLTSAQAAERVNNRPSPWGKVLKGSARSLQSLSESLPLNKVDWTRCFALSCAIQELKGAKLLFCVVSVHTVMFSSPEIVNKCHMPAFYSFISFWNIAAPAQVAAGEAAATRIANCCHHICKY